LQRKIKGDVPVDTAFHLSSKSGPNGPLLETIEDDAKAFTKDKRLVEAWRTLNASVQSSAVADVGFGQEIIRSLPSPPITSPLDHRSKRRELLLELANLSSAIAESSLLHSRLAAIPAAGCKTRIVAICDWFTQDALKPLHEWAYRCLKKIRQDGTFSHNQIALRAKRYSALGFRAWCFDLSSATDRFPAKMQREMLRLILGQSTADAWYTLVTERTFSMKGQGGIIYAVGQPMGALSSWAIFSLTHHLVVQVAAMCVGFPKRKWFSGYVLIGDDIAIFHKDVAKAYQRILRTLGVPVNLTKSMTPPTQGLGAIEIAKRTFLQGVEMSPVPPDVIVQAKKDPKVFPMLIRLSQERGIANAHSQGPVL